MPKLLASYHYTYHLCTNNVLYTCHLSKEDSRRILYSNNMSLLEYIIGIISKGDREGVNDYRVFLYIYVDYNRNINNMMVTNRSPARYTSLEVY